MPLTPGTRLGPYEIVSPLGAGGMGEVYRARDTKLNRDVALKVLPDLFARDPDRLARFTREAQTLAEAGGSGTYDIYVRPFPGPGGTWRISTTGGIYPKWSATTHELLFANYLDPTPSKIMAASYVVVGDSFQVETPKVWSPTSVQKANTTNSAYDLHPDGKRIAAAAVADQGNTLQDKVVFVFNFAEYLAKIAPGKK